MIMHVDWPVAPPVEDLDGPEFLFTISTGAFGLGDGTVWGIPHGALGIETAVDIDGLDATDFWRRGGPVLAFHEPDKVLGRTMQLFQDEGRLKAVMRFAKTALGAEVRRSLEPHGPAGQTNSWAASIRIEHNPFDVTIDAAARRIMIRKAMLIEWSLVTQGADPGAKSEGRVILRVIKDSAKDKGGGRA